MQTRSASRSNPLSPPPSSPNNVPSPYSLSKENGNNTTDEIEGMTGDLEQLQRMTEGNEDLTTSGWTYQELVEQMGRDQSENESIEYNRKSVGVYLAGRNSMSNWTTFNVLDEAELSVNVPLSVAPREERVSSLETPLITKLDASCVNLSQRRSHVNSRQRSTSQRVKSNASYSKFKHSLSQSRRSNNLNLSHISSSSSSMSDVMGESWSPIRSSFENSFEKSLKAGEKSGRGLSKSPLGTMNETDSEFKSPKRQQSKSPLKDARSKSPKRSARNSRSKSPKRSPIRSPLADVSPNRSRALSPKASNKSRSLSPQRALSPKKSPLKSSFREELLSPNQSGSLSPVQTLKSSLDYSAEEEDALKSESPLEKTSPPQASVEKAKLSPNGTYSLKEAEATNETDKPASPIPAQLSPKRSTFNRMRSPAPTPNSQRRDMKRFRASLPAARYLMPEDEILEKDEEKVETKVKGSEVGDSYAVSEARGEEKASETFTEVEAPEEKESESTATYECEFKFPAISGPRNATLSQFYEAAIAQGPSSHQYLLTAAKTKALSMHEVVLPSIAYDTSAVLKKMQSRAHRKVIDGKPDSQGKNVVEAIELCRKVVKKTSTHVIEQVEKQWREHDEKRQQANRELQALEKKRQKELRAQAKLQRKQERALARQQYYERQKYERKKNHPRNKEMWQEVARLMMEIPQLEKEERLWKETLAEVESMEKNFQPPEKMELSLNKSTRASEQDELCKSVENTEVETKTTNLLQDFTVATERISWMLQSVSRAVDESDGLRMEAYHKYQDGQKFYGYQYGDRNGLFVALSMDDSFVG